MYKREDDEKATVFSKLDEVTALVKDVKTTVSAIQSTTGSATATYIDGEANAFKALCEAVREAKFSLCSSRFANESIVQKLTKEQEQFMKALYQASTQLNEKFIRIICNNHPTKWKDIFNILSEGGDYSRVYVRKADFSIHFELVVIDEEVAFVHFYQADHSNNLNNENNGDIEKLNSTLRIRGGNICKKFKNIFDRLHHRDFENAKEPCDPSRTLLGIPTDPQVFNEVASVSDIQKIGYFTMPKNVPSYNRYPTIMKMFKKAFKEWRFDDSDVDKLNMVTGIALLESSPQFIEEMYKAKDSTGREYLDEEQYRKAMQMYDINIQAASSFEDKS